MKGKYVLRGLLVVLLLVGLCAFINPNTFGNQPSIIGDEGYFLTSAMKALQGHTIPGLISDPTAAYYGGVLSYILFFVIGIGGAMARLLGMQQSALTAWMAYHWGDLLHIGRLVNGLAVYGTLIWLSWRALKQARVQARPAIAWFAALLVLSLCGGSVFLVLTHTSKVWPLYVVFEIISAWLVCSQQWSIETKQETHLLKKKTYLNYLAILSALSFSQVMLGSLTFLWIVDAFILKQVTFEDAKEWAKQPLVWISAALFSVLHISFVKNFIHLARSLSTVGNVSGNVIAAAHPWLERMIWPIRSLAYTSPFLFALFIVALILFCVMKQKERLNKVLLSHVALVYLLFYVLLGFGLQYRYVLPFTLVVAVFVAATFMERERARWLIAGASLILAVAVIAKTAWLFWNPSSEQRLAALLKTVSIPADGVLVIEGGHFQPPVLNEASIQRTEQVTGKPIFRRFDLLRNVDKYQKEIPSYTVVPLDHPVERALFRDFSEVWVIEEDLSACEHNPGEPCWIINKEQRETAESTDLISLLKAPMVGRSYVLHRVGRKGK